MEDMAACDGFPFVHISALVTGIWSMHNNALQTSHNKGSSTTMRPNAIS